MTIQSDNTQYQNRLNTAVICYLERQSRSSHPSGKFGKARRWEPDDGERRKCCDGIRMPSRAWPYSLMQHCCTMLHIAQLYDVDLRALRTMVAAARKGV